MGKQLNSILDDLRMVTHTLEAPKSARLDDNDPNDVYGAIAPPNTLDTQAKWFLFNQKITSGVTITKWAAGTVDGTKYIWEATPGDGYYKSVAVTYT
jgi:hypothetical protein